MKAKDLHEKSKSPRAKSAIWPLDKGNYRLFGFGILVLIVGYIFLAQGPWDSFSSRTLAPILLVIGYCVIIPYAIYYQKKKDKSSTSN